jgi:hypothetical protein
LPLLVLGQMVSMEMQRTCTRLWIETSEVGCQSSSKHHAHALASLLSSCLTTAISLRSVYGLNLTVPEDAKEVIKPFDQREDEDKYIESGVDDQVTNIPCCPYR